MKISVVIPAHNEDSVIGQAVKSCLSQSKPPFEVIVVNDGSTDNTVPIVRDIAKHNKSVRIVENDGRSAASSRNKGVEAAKGDVIVFLDADEYFYEKDYLEQVERAFEDPKVMTASSTGFMYMPRPLPHTFVGKAAFTRMVARNNLERSKKEQYVWMIRKDFFQKVGGLPDNVFYFEESVFKNKIKKYGGKHVVLNIHRYHLGPYTLEEYFRQSKAVGKGLTTHNVFKENKFIAFYPLNPGFWYSLPVSLALGLVFTPFLTVFLFLFLVTVYKLVQQIYYSRLVLPSLFFIFVMSPLRSLYILYSFLKFKLKKRKAPKK